MTGPKIEPLRTVDIEPIRNPGRPSKHGAPMQQVLRVRVTGEQWQSFHNKGGADWLRGLLSDGV